MIDPAQLFRIGELTVAPSERRAWVHDRELPLTAREFDVLTRLAERPGWVFTPEQLSDDSDPQRYASPYAVNVHVSHLRAKLSEGGAPKDLIETVRGVGWRLRRPVPTPGDEVPATASLGELVAAARTATAGHDYEAAIDLLGKALDRFDAAEPDSNSSPRVRSVLLERRGSAQMARERAALAQEDYESALALRPPRDHFARARLYTRLGYAAFVQRNRGAAETALAKARAELDTETVRGPVWWQAWIEVHLQHARATCLTDLPLWDPAVATTLEQAVEEHGTTAQKAKYHLAVADTELYRARWAVNEPSLSHMRKALGFAVETGSTYLQSLAAGQLGSILIFAGQYAEAEVRLRQAIDLAERCDDSLGVQAATTFLSLGARLSGDVRGAERHAIALRRLIEANPGPPEFDCTAAGQLAWVALRRGDRTTAKRLSEEAVTSWERDPSMSQSVWVMAWPAVACALAEEDATRAFEYARLMTRPDQQVLADGHEARIAEVVAAYGAGDLDTAVAALHGLEAEAHRLNYA